MLYEVITVPDLQDGLQESQDEVDVEAPLVGFVHHDHAVPGQEGVVLHRITSYNVCYTKLLRIINNFLEGFSIIPLVFYRVRQNAKLFVFLSISRVLIQAILTYIFIVIYDWGLIGNYYGRLFSLIPFTLIYIVIILKNATSYNFV